MKISAMRTIGIIPARYASTRFPGKPLVDILGKSMIRRVYEACVACPDLDGVIVATDDERIFGHLEGIGAQVEMTSPSHLNGTERIAEVARRHPSAELIVNIQGDEPCIPPAQISALVELMRACPRVGIGTLARRQGGAEILSRPHTVKVVFDEVTHKARSFHRVLDSLPTSGVWGKHIGIYAFRRDTLQALVRLPPSPNEQALGLEQLRWLDRGYDIAIAWAPFDSPSVDTPEDLPKVIRYFS